MDIILAALLAGKTVLPTIDRQSLELQARAEALQSRAAPASARRPAVRRAASSGSLDLGSITTICRAAGNQTDPAGFITRISRAYSLSNDESSSLRSSCAAYLAGRADAGRTAD
ncbi:hypothetical protein [Sphingosinicella terrae]|jgi:hypothetical protein|uniref:hypothetical protein n=1 Tax=Sphingosinicella terrae TaxID=2172047 RepID=UPI000E0D9C06|nr:hypothetical protein [Sphingosinicella terrae]